MVLGSNATEWLKIPGAWSRAALPFTVWPGAEDDSPVAALLGPVRTRPAALVP